MHTNTLCEQDQSNSKVCGEQLSDVLCPTRPIHPTSSIWPKPSVFIQITSCWKIGRPCHETSVVWHTVGNLLLLRFCPEVFCFVHLLFHVQCVSTFTDSVSLLMKLCFWCVETLESQGLHHTWIWFKQSCIPSDRYSLFRTESNIHIPCLLHLTFNPLPG